MVATEPQTDPSSSARSRVLGLATTTYFGGRTECHIRRTIVPVAYCDFASMYLTVNALMGLSELLTAHRIHVVESTEAVRRFLEVVTAEDLFHAETWRQLPAIVEVLPDQDVLPARAHFGDEIYSTYGIGVNPLNSLRPLWYTLADCVASKLRTGRTPRILRALRFMPEGRQDLKPVALRGQVPIDPRFEDFFRRTIEERRKVKRGEPPYDTLETEDRNWLEQFLKVLVNATSYGIYMEMNRQKGMRGLVQVHGLRTFEREIDGPEVLGPYAFPVLATQITGGGRLMLALAQHEVQRRGGHYAFMDTDSIAIVATESGGLVPCPGGPERLPDGTEAIRALSWQEVEAIRDRFRALNPYGDHESILELEKENWELCGLSDHKPGCVCIKVRRQLYAYAVASKRYALFNLSPDGERALRVEHASDDAKCGIDADLDAVVRKYSEHALGAYESPRHPGTGKRIEKWEREVWHYLISRALGKPVELPAWAFQPAVTQVRISTPAMLRWFDAFNRAPDGTPKSYAEAVKPHNFLSHSIVKPLTALPADVDPARFCLVAPAGERRRFANRHEPQGHLYLAGIDFTPKTYADVIEAYDTHPERKFAGPDGLPCRAETRGLLGDLPLFATGIKHVGKESNELEEHRAGLVADDERQLEYDDSFLADLRMVLQEVSTQTIAKATGHNPRTIRRIKAGDGRPSAAVLKQLVVLAGIHARSALAAAGHPQPVDDVDALGFYAGMLARPRS